jgi:NitT/TauT family transport system substrate-binding protein
MVDVSRRQFAVGAATAAAAALLPAPCVIAQSDFTAPAVLRVGFAPYTSNGPYFIAETKGYFKKLNLQVVGTRYFDGSLSLPSLAAGELDIVGATLSAGLFNLMSKGGGMRMFFERGREAPRWGSNAIMVSNEMWEKGFRSVDGYKYAKGARIGMTSRGSVEQYLHTAGLDRAGLVPDDVDWQWSMPTEVALALMQQSRIDIIDVALPGAYQAQKRGVGRIATWSDELAPNFVLTCSVASEKALREKRSALVRFSMAIMQGVAEFMDAANSGNPEIIKILADNTGLSVPLIDETRPRWTFMTADGLPNMASIIAQQNSWHQRTELLARTVPEDQLFDDSMIKEARKRLDDKNPFF